MIDRLSIGIAEIHKLEDKKHLFLQKSNQISKSLRKSKEKAQITDVRNLEDSLEN